MLPPNKPPVATESTCNPITQTSALQVIKYFISQVENQSVAVPEIQTADVVQRY